MKLLYLTPNYDQYSASLYQRNTYKYLSRHCQLILWGPGFENFDHELELSQLVNKFNLSKDDALCVGHGWLSDYPLNGKTNSKYLPYGWLLKRGAKLNLNSLEFCKEYDFNEFNGKKIIILNKEYVSLNEKLNFIKKNNFNIVLCLNPNYKLYENKTGIKFKFWPNAIDSELFKKKDTKKNYDLCFSGLIQNFTVEETSADSNEMRSKIFKKIFFQFYGIKIAKKPLFKKHNIFWNSYSGKKYFDMCLKLLKKYQFLNYEHYLDILASSKATLNTLGPSGLIGPRYFECMLSNSICFAEESSLYKEIFIENENYISFKKDLSDFSEKLAFAVSDSNEIEKIKKNAYELVLLNHTYDRRAKDLIKWTEEINN